jgi:hypothetical protein
MPADKVQRTCARLMMREFGKRAKPPRTFLAQTGVQVNVKARLLPGLNRNAGRQIPGHAHAGASLHRHEIGPRRYSDGKATVNAGHHRPNVTTADRRDADGGRGNGSRRASRNGAGHTPLSRDSGRRQDGGDEAEEHSHTRGWLRARRLSNRQRLLRDLALRAMVRNAATHGQSNGKSDPREGSSETVHSHRLSPSWGTSLFRDDMMSRRSPNSNRLC